MKTLFSTRTAAYETLVIAKVMLQSFAKQLAQDIGISSDVQKRRDVLGSFQAEWRIPNKASKNLTKAHSRI